MITIIAVFIMAAVTSYAKFDPIWSDLPSQYTNIIGADFVRESRDRVRWLSGTNRTYDVVLQWNGNYFTNKFGTNPIPFTAPNAEVITDVIEGVMPRYVLAAYQTSGKYDAWFNQIDTNALSTNWMDRFPLGDTPKGDLFFRYNIGKTICQTGVFEAEYGSSVLDRHPQWIVGVQSNAYGEPTNTQGVFTKRLDRKNPHHIASWKYGEKEFSGGYLIDDGLGSRIRDNEFCMNAEYGNRVDTINEYPAWSRMLTNSMMPKFIVDCGDQAYSGGLKLVVTEDLIQGDLMWQEDNSCAGGMGVEGTAPAFAEKFGAEILLPNKTTVSPYPFFALYGALTLTGTPSWVEVYTNGLGQLTTNYRDTVSLIWDDPMTVYEGTKVWDINLFPEQLDEHYRTMMQMYLTEVKWDSGMIGWTNGVAYVWTNAVYPATNIVDSFTTNSSYRVYVDDFDFPWWRGDVTGLPPWFWNPLSLGDMVIISNAVDAYPMFSMNMSLSMSLEDSYEATVNFDPPLSVFAEPFPDQDDACSPTGDINPPLWSIDATRTDSLSFSLLATNQIASLYIKDLYSGTQHRAHIYVKMPIDPNNVSLPYYHLIETTPWTYDEVVVSSPINPGEYLGSVNLPMTTTETFEEGETTDTIYWEQTLIGSVSLPIYTNYSFYTNGWTTNYYEEYVDPPGITTNLLVSNGVATIISTNYVLTNVNWDIYGWKAMYAGHCVLPAPYPDVDNQWIYGDFSTNFLENYSSDRLELASYSNSVGAYPSWTNTYYLGDTSAYFSASAYVVTSAPPSNTNITLCDPQYIITDPPLFDPAYALKTIVLARPCDIGGQISGYFINEFHGEYCTTNVLSTNGLSVKVLMEWKTD